MRRVVPLVVLTLLAGCTSNNAVSSSSTRIGSDYTQSPQTSATATPTEGPVTETHRWPDGITARVVSVQRLDPAHLGFSSSDPTNDAAVLVTVEFGNEGTSTLSWATASQTPDWKLLYGVNRTLADGYAAPNAARLPTRLVPGTTATWQVVDFLPSSALADQLALELTPLWNDPSHPEWIFTGLSVA